MPHAATVNAACPERREPHSPLLGVGCWPAQSENGVYIPPSSCPLPAAPAVEFVTFQGSCWQRGLCWRGSFVMVPPGNTQRSSIMMTHLFRLDGTLRLVGVLALASLVMSAAPQAALAHGHGGGHGSGRRAQAIKDANSWRDGFRGPHDFGGGVTIPQDAGLNKGLGGGLDGRGFGAAALSLDGGGRLDGSDWPLDGGATQGYRSGRFAGDVDMPNAKPSPKPNVPRP